MPCPSNKMEKFFINSLTRTVIGLNEVNHTFIEIDRFGYTKVSDRQGGEGTSVLSDAAHPRTRVSYVTELETLKPVPSTCIEITTCNARVVDERYLERVCTSLLRQLQWVFGIRNLLMRKFCRRWYTVDCLRLFVGCSLVTVQDNDILSTVYASCLNLWSGWTLFV